MSVQTGPGRYVLFGHPVGHSWSPFIHGLFARQFDHVVDYKLRDVAPAEFRHEVINFFVALRVSKIKRACAASAG